MRILLCNFHEALGGGQDTYLLQLINALDTQHAVAVACPPHSRLYTTLQETVPCFAINYKAIFRKWQIASLWKFKRWLEKQAFDVIHINGSADHRAVLSVYPFLKHRPRLVLTKHNALKIKPGAWLRMHYGSDAIIAVSQATRRHLLQAGLPAHKIETIPNGIDTEFYQPVSPAEKKRLRIQYGLSEQDWVFVSNAGTARCKNWFSLLTAIAALPPELRSPIRVLIAGTLPSTADQLAIQSLGLASQVMFTGFLTDVRPLLGVGDIGFVLSNAEETISFACREMMAMGLPMLVSNYGGLPENVTPQQDGWIVLCNDLAALTRTLISLFTQKETLTALGQQARKKAVTAFTAQPFIEQTLKLYERLLNAEPRSHR